MAILKVACSTILEHVLGSMTGSQIQTACSWFIVSSFIYMTLLGWKLSHHLAMATIGYGSANYGGLLQQIMVGGHKRGA